MQYGIGNGTRLWNPPCYGLAIFCKAPHTCTFVGRTALKLVANKSRNFIVYNFKYFLIVSLNLFKNILNSLIKYPAINLKVAKGRKNINKNFINLKVFLSSFKYS